MKRDPWIAWCLGGSLALLCACSPSSADHAINGADSGASVDPLTCSVAPPTACPDPAPHYPDIAPIIMERCVSCHSGIPNGPWPLTQYEHVADWQDTIRSNLLDCSMPPPEAAIPMTNSERLAILVWIRCGFPR